MRVRNAFLALAATAAAFATTGVGVSPAFARGIDVVTVGYSDLNLASETGRRALDNRIDAAIDIVCSDGYVVPVVYRPRVSATNARLVAHLSGWDNDLWALAHWYRETAA